MRGVSWPAEELAAFHGLLFILRIIQTCAYSEDVYVKSVDTYFYHSPLNGQV
jgi:hypothetical protein